MNESAQILHQADPELNEDNILGLLSEAFFSLINTIKPAWCTDYTNKKKLCSAINSPILRDQEISRVQVALPKSIEEFALYYEQLISYELLKKGGVFYTPAPVADLIIENAISNCKQELIISNGILDPSCGGGIFLVRAFNFLKKQFETDKIISLLNGVDRDPLAVEVAKLALMLSAKDSKLSASNLYNKISANLFSGNSLISSNDHKGENSFDWHNKFPAIKKGGFACIIGNPPYGLSRNEQISKEENALLKKLYSEFRVGKVNKYLLFIAKGSELLAEQGILSFIVPNSWLGIRSGSAIRELLLNKLCLEEISFFDGKIFPKASVETIIFRAKKTVPNTSVKLICRSAKVPAKIEYQSDLSLDFCKKKLAGRIPLIWNKKFENVLDTIYSNSVKIGDEASGFRSYIALQAYAVGIGTPPQTKEQVKSHCFHSQIKIDETYYPYLAGSDIGRYRIAPHKSFLKYGPWLAEPQKFERFDGSRILIREILSRGKQMLSAAYIEKTAFYNKSVLHILPQKKIDKNIILALSGILNSSVASLILFLTGRKTQRALFPKIVNGDLLDFPIPLSLYQAPNKIAELVINQQAAQSSATNDHYEIDLEVAKAYGLDSSVLKEIDQFLEHSQKLILAKKM